MERTEEFIRLEELLCNCIDYILELKERESLEEKIDFFKNIIGMTDNEIRAFSLDYE